MTRPKAKAPARRYHISGQSVVTIAGSDFYLGPHDSPKAIARYVHRLQDEAKAIDSARVAPSIG